MKVLLSIKPEYVERMATGEKLFEYRKKMFKKQVESVVVYATKPVGKIVGEFTVKKIIKDSPQRLWEQTREYTGITLDFFMLYFHGEKTGPALEINKFTLYEKPVQPEKRFENFIAPQSFRYVDDDYLTNTY